MDHFPIAEPTEPAAVAPGAGGDLRDGRAALSPTPRVLVVDDDAQVRETLADQLELLGFATLPVSGGEAALALLDAGAEVDLLLSDLSMPGIDGIETIRQARLRRPSLPCVLITGFPGARVGGISADSFRLLRKPVGCALLGAELRASLAGAD